MENHINCLEECSDEPTSINQIQGAWELLPCTLDSGAIDWVTPKSTATKHTIKESRLSKAGMGYKAANGTSIKNYGQTEIRSLNENWQSVGVIMQVADVKKTLAAAIKICQAGNRIVLDVEEGQSFIQNKGSGEKTPVHIRNGEFQFDLWVEAPEKEEVNIIEATKKVIQEEIKAVLSGIKVSNRYDCLEDDSAAPFTGPAIQR